MNKNSLRIICAGSLILFFLTSSLALGTTVLKLPVYRSAGQLWLDNEGNLKGFRLEILNELNHILAKDDIRLEYKLGKGGTLPIKRAISEIITGKYDAYFGLIPSEARKKAGLRFSSQDIYTIPTVVWMKKGNEFEYNGLDSLKGKKIGIVLGYPYLQEDKGTGISIEKVRNDQINVKKLVLGRIDAIIDNIIRTGTVITEQGLSDKVTYSDKIFDETKFKIAYNKSVPENIIQKIDNALKRMYYSGFISNILTKNIYNPLRKK